MNGESTAVVICSVLERDAPSTERTIASVPAGSALIELRGDHLRAGEIETLVREAGRPILVTVRRAADGGAFDGSEAERRESLEAALRGGARYVDVERESGLVEIAEGPFAGRTVLSDHGAPCRLGDLSRLYDAMRHSRAARLKIVPRATCAGEAAAVRELLARGDDRPGRLACFAMGRGGALTRLLACSWGSWATFGSARAGAETAEGQLTARDLLDVYDVLSVDEGTRMHALVGGSLALSPSPAMHRAAYVRCGLNARYLPLEIDRIEEIVPLLGESGIGRIRSFGVTMPFKEEAARRSRPGDALATAAAAVNTVLVEPDAWLGYNTDGPAAVERTRKHEDPDGARVAVLGAGGTARAVCAAFLAAGSRVTLFNRDVDRARRAARSLGAGHRALQDLPRATWEILVNATPVGSRDETVLPASALSGRMVLDVVYRQGMTPLVRDARERGLAVVDGVELLAAQAVLQFERMTGGKTDFDTMHAAARLWLEAHRA